MKEIILNTKIEVYQKAELPEVFAVLAQTALEAAYKAYAPYSHFHVGASVLLENGKVVTGNNQENAAYPSGLCAERVALFAAGAQYPDIAVSTLAIAAVTEGKQVKLITPCGACRQVLLEPEARSKQPVQILLCGSDEVYLINSASALLPLSFDGTDLPS
jgi:cytidine deaminase